MWNTVGVIIIGRNEGERLKAALQSCLTGKNPICLYVDSGSTDGSVELAKTIGIKVHELDPSRPFSAARARREGVEIMSIDYPELDFYQFLDSDCTLLSGWLSRAREFIIQRDDVAIVCGLLREAAPGRSIYNKINAVQWNVPSGEIDSCGGIFMIRRNVYEEVGGFNSLLLTGEEPELCARIRAAGYRIIRLNYEMACHDSGLVCFSEWWKRAVWGGYGDAIEFRTLDGEVTQQRQRETHSSLFWGALIPLLSFSGLIGMFWSVWFAIIPLMCGLGYLALLLKVMLYRMQRGDSMVDALPYSLFCVLRKIPSAIGYLLYRFNLETIFKRPDPHAPVTDK
jgi:GT2 family glycosyltransferase